MYHYSMAPCADFYDALRLLPEVGISNLESDGTILGKSFDALTPSQLEDAREALVESGIRIVSARLSCSLTDDAAVRRFFAAAHWLGVENVLAPAPETEDLTAYMELLRNPARYAQSYGIGFLIVNDAQSALKTEQAVAQVVRSLAEYDCGAVFDTAEYQKTGAYPFFGALYSSHIKNSYRMIRMGDLAPDGSPVPLCHGVCGLRECVSLLLARSFDGYFSLPQLYGQKNAEDWKHLLNETRQMLKKL